MENRCSCQPRISHEQLSLNGVSDSCSKRSTEINAVGEQCLLRGADTEWILQQCDQPPVEKATKPRGCDPRFRAKLDDLQ